MSLIFASWLNPQPSTTHMIYNIEIFRNTVRGAVMRMQINSGMHFKIHNVGLCACVSLRDRRGVSANTKFEKESSGRYNVEAHSLLDFFFLSFE